MILKQVCQKFDRIIGVVCSVSCLVTCLTAILPPQFFILQWNGTGYHRFNGSRQHPRMDHDGDHDGCIPLDDDCIAMYCRLRIEMLLVLSHLVHSIADMHQIHNFIL